MCGPLQLPRPPLRPLPTAAHPHQGKILTAVAALIDEGKVQATGTSNLGAVTAANVMAGHALLEDGHVVGKLVLSGWA